MADLWQFRRDTAANWTSVNPTLAAGELGVETDTLRGKLGDGTTAWTGLSYVAFGDASDVVVVNTIASGTITPTGTTDLVRPAALSAALTIANPSTTPADGAGLVVDLIDNGTTRALTWGSKYTNRMATLPTATTAGKRHRIGVEYNAADDKLYCMYAQVQP